MRDKINILCPPLDSAACFQLRLGNPLTFLEKKGLVDIQTFGSAVENEKKVAHADVVLFQRVPPKRHKGVFTFCRRNNKVTVLDIDDNFFALPKTHPEYKNFFRRLLVGRYRRLKHFLLNASCVFVPTERLRQSFLRYNKRIYVLPNTIQEEWFLKQPPAHQMDNSCFKIGFYGSRTHLTDFREAFPAVQKLLQEYSRKIQLYFLGMPPPSLINLDEVKYIPYDERYQESLGVLNRIGLHAGLAPLQDNSFNECKSNIKFLEYSACSIPGIYSNVGPYAESVKHMQTGLLVSPGDTEGWRHSMKMLIENDNLRTTIAQNAKREAFEKYTIQKNYHKWHDVFRSLASHEMRVR